MYSTWPRSDAMVECFVIVLITAPVEPDLTGFICLTNNGTFMFT